ncbi:MAG: presenilin family intramembrane aspartyl protease [bacterium]|nr:presenilin family intramembrane aspartyl protease [bacterium]
MVFKDFKLKIYFWEAVLFAATQGIGLWTAVQAKNLFKETGIEAPGVSWWVFLVYFAAATAFLLLFIRFIRRSGAVLKIFFAFSLFFGMQIVAGFVLPGILAILAPLGLVIIYFLSPFVWLHNFILIISIAGIGGLLGLNLNPRGVIVILAILALYDYWAVYKTKHMVKMAKAFVKESVIPAIILPLDFHGFKKRAKEVKPGGEFYLLGSGDLIFPLILASSALSIGLINAVFVSAFSLLGLFIVHLIFVFQEKRAPMPALPPIAAMSILGLLVSLFFNK